MPVTVHIPTRIRVDPGTLMLRCSCVESALTAAATRALKNSQDVVLAQRGGFVGVRFHPPEFSWSGDGLAQVPSVLRSRIERSVSEVFLESATDLGFFDQKADPADITTNIREPFRRNRILASLPIYGVASYEGGGAKVPVKDFEFEDFNVTAPIQTVWKMITSSDMFDRLLATELLVRNQKVPSSGYFGVIYYSDDDRIYIYVSRYPGPNVLFDMGIENLVSWNPSTKQEGIQADPIGLPADAYFRLKWLAHAGSKQQNIEIYRKGLGSQLRSSIASAYPKLSSESVTALLNHTLSEAAERVPEVTKDFVLLLVNGAPFMIKAPVSVPTDLDVELIPLTIERNIPTDAKADGTASAVERDTHAVNQDSSKTSVERGCFKFNVFDTRDEDEYCSRFRGEPKLSELGDSGKGIVSLMDEIAGKLGIPTCDFAGRFCVRAAEAIHLGAGFIGNDLRYSEIAGQLDATPKGSGNLKSVDLTLSRTPAVNQLRDLAAITPRLTILSSLVRDMYDQVGRSNRPDCPSEVGSWLLHFTIDKNDILGPAVARIFKQACRSALLQLLYATRKSIFDRQARVGLLAEVFKSTVLPLLLTIDDLLQLRERLKKARQELAQNAVGIAYMTMAHQAGNESGTASTNPFGLSEDIVLKDFVIQGIKDKQGTVWTDETLEATIVLRRGVAEELDPVVKHISDLPDVVARLRLDPNQTEAEITSVLESMKSKNQEFIDKARNSESFAFGMSKIIETSKSKDIQIPNTAYQLQGFHLMAHEQVGDAFEGDWSYPFGIKYLFDAELGFEELTSIGEFVGIVALSVICAPLGFIAGVGTALYHYAEAKEKERFYDAFMDPEEFISRAEIEAELFGAKLGLALSFIPEGGKIISNGVKGVKLAVEEGAVSAVRSTVRAAARKVLEEMAERLAQGLVTELVKELVKAEILNKVLSLFIEPVIRAVEREALITGPVGGLDEAASTLERLHLNLPGSTQLKESAE